MKTPVAKQKACSNDLLWYFLAELPLSEIMPDHDRGNEPAAGSLCQTMRELGIPPECAENIEMTITKFAREALAHFEPGRLDPPEHIRIFCQKKMIGEKMNGGCGYFLIERTERFQHFVDLYLYREGE